MDPATQKVLDIFMATVDKRLESVLDVNSRLMKENIELRKKLKDAPVATLPHPPQAPNSGRPPFSSSSFSGDKKKVIMEVVRGTADFRFRGNGTYDAKEIIKTMGEARFDSDTKAWVLTPTKSVDFITQTLKKDFDFQFVE